MGESEHRRGASEHHPCDPLISPMGCEMLSLLIGGRARTRTLFFRLWRRWVIVGLEEASVGGQEGNEKWIGVEPLGMFGCKTV